MAHDSRQREAVIACEQHLDGAVLCHALLEHVDQLRVELSVRRQAVEQDVLYSPAGDEGMLSTTAYPAACGLALLSWLAMLGRTADGGAHSRQCA